MSILCFILRLFVNVTGQDCSREHQLCMVLFSYCLLDCGSVSVAVSRRSGDAAGKALREHFTGP